MVEKINVYKTIENSLKGGFLGVKSAYVSEIDNDSCSDLFLGESENLLHDCDSDEFKKIVDEAINEMGIYIALAYVYESSFDGNENHLGVGTQNGKFNINKIDVDIESDYGVIIDNNLEISYAHRFCGDFSSGSFYVNIDLNSNESELVPLINDCIVYE